MTDVARARRLAVRIREIVATTLEQRVKDPRLGMVTIVDSKVTPDLREATIYYTVYGDEAAHTASAAALESARGVLRAEVGRQTGVRYTPTLAFVADRVQETAAHISDLIAEARAADADLARVRQGARYAGDPDPYRTPATERDGEDPAGTGDQLPPDPVDAGGATGRDLR